MFPTPEEACPRGPSPTVCSVSIAEGSAFLFVLSLQLLNFLKRKKKKQEMTFLVYLENNLALSWNLPEL